MIGLIPVSKPLARKALAPIETDMRRNGFPYGVAKERGHFSIWRLPVEGDPKAIVRREGLPSEWEEPIE